MLRRWKQGDAAGPNPLPALRGEGSHNSPALLEATVKDLRSDSMRGGEDADEKTEKKKIGV
jgi:hypothetical protein